MFLFVLNFSVRCATKHTVHSVLCLCSISPLIMFAHARVLIIFANQHNSLSCLNDPIGLMAHFSQGIA